MKISRTWINFSIAVAAYFWSRFVDTSEFNSFVRGTIVFVFLEIPIWFKYIKKRDALLGDASYKAEIIVELDVEELIYHEFVRDRFEQARVDVASKKDLEREHLMELYRDDHEQGAGIEYLLRNVLSMRFLIINGLFWSDLHKTFKDRINFEHRLLGSDYADAKHEEREVWIRIDKGMLSVGWGFEGDMTVYEKGLICQFPLYIFRNLSWHRVGVSDDAWDRAGVSNDAIKCDKDWREDFFRARRKAARSGELDLRPVRQVLERYGFEAIAHYNEHSMCSFRGDLHDAFSHFKNKYMVVRFRELA